jgi:hypothetical protein
MISEEKELDDRAFDQIDNERRLMQDGHVVSELTDMVSAMAKDIKDLKQREKSHRTSQADSKSTRDVEVGTMRMHDVTRMFQMHLLPV